MNKILNIIDRIILILASVIFIILIGCISILPIAKSKSYYLKEQDRNKVELALSFHYCDTLTNVLTGDFFMHIGTIISITFIGILVFSIILCGLFKKYGSHLKSTLFKKQNKKHLFSTL